MSFLDKFTKGVGKAAEQAKFEADKLVRVNRLGSEVSQLHTEVLKATAAIGTKVMEMRSAGTLQVPELDEMVQRVEALQGQFSTKQAELERVRAEKFGDVPPAPQPAASSVEPTYAPPPVAPAAEAASAPQPTAPAAEAVPKFCPGCGTPTEPGAKFCPSCGEKLG